MVNNKPTRRKFRVQWKEKFSWLEEKEQRAYCKICKRFLINHLTHLSKHSKKNSHIRKRRQLRIESEKSGELDYLSSESSEEDTNKINSTRSRTGKSKPDTKRKKDALNPISTCRVCLQSGEEGEEMASIFAQDVDAVCLYEKIESCGGIKILRDPELPTRICKKCKGFLVIAHKFRLMCRKSDNYLREFVWKYASNQSIGEEHCDDGDDDNDDHNDTAEGVKSKVFTIEQVLQEVCNNLDETEHSIGYEESAVAWMDEDGNPVDLIEEDHEDGSQNAPSSKPIQKHQKKQTEEDGKNTEIKKEETNNGAAVKSRRSRTRGNEKHICYICGIVYPRKWSLNAHIKRHCFERPFACEICSQTFQMSAQLVRHMRVHTGVRPYSCKYCQRTFSDHSTRHRHERVHRNERPYKCDACSKTFTYSHILKRHKFTHTGERPFVCGICGKGFACAYRLRAHLETLQHKNDPRTALLLQKIKREEDVWKEEADGDEQDFNEANE